MLLNCEPKTLATLLGLNSNFLLLTACQTKKKSFKVSVDLKNMTSLALYACESFRIKPFNTFLL